MQVWVFRWYLLEMLKIMWVDSKMRLKSRVAEKASLQIEVWVGTNLRMTTFLDSVDWN